MTELLEFDGGNPLRSVVSPHAPGVDSNGRYPFTDFVDLYTDGARRIRKRIGSGAAFATIPAGCVAIHEFERVDPTTGVVSYYQFAVTAANIYRWNGSSFAADTLPITPSGAYWCFLNFENRCFAVNGKDEMIVFDGTSWRIVGIDAPATTPTYSLGGIVTAGTVSITSGSATVTGSGTSFDNSSAWNALYIDVNGIRYQIQSVTSTTVLTLTETIKESTAAGLPYKVYAGVMSWSNPPKYAVAYYNPTTGHCSEPSPTIQITEKDQIGVTPTISLAGSAQNTTAYNAGYTQFKLFRPFKEGSQMRSMNVVINNNNSASSISFTETSTSGKNTILTDLLLPKETNRKPPTALGSLASWQGRMWAHRAGDPTNTPPDSPRSYFCCVTDETSIGVAEECWPRRFERHGIVQPKMILSIGGEGSANGLVIVASDGDYTLDGYDNLTFTNPYRMPTRRSGGFLFGAIDVSGTLVELYRDKRLMAGDIDLGEPIQDKLNAITASAITSARLHRFSYETNDLIFVMIPKGASSNNWILVFDQDRSRINEWQIALTALGTCHAADGSLELWAGGSGGNIYRLLQAGVFQDISPYTPMFKTGPIRRAIRTELRRVHLFVGPTSSGAAALTWTLTVRTDEDSVGKTYVLAPAPADRQSAAGNELMYEFESPVVFNTLSLQVTFPTTSTDLYVEKMYAILDPVQVSAAST